MVLFDPFHFIIICRTIRVGDVFVDGLVNLMTCPPKTGPESDIILARFEEEVITTATNLAGTVTIAYYNRSRVMSVTDVFGQAVSYQYDANSNRTQLSLNGASNATYQYDVINRLTQLTNNTSLATTFAYDATNKLTSRTLPNGVVSTYQYDGLDRLTRLTHAKAPNTLLDLQYQFNAVNNITQMIDSAGTRNYSYDNLDRLTAATHPNQPNESYTLDDVGNRTASHQGSSYSYQAFNRLVTANGTTLGYDTNGNLTSKGDASGNWTYIWDYENRLKEASKAGVVTVTYSYDALGRRIQQSSSTSGTTKFVYDGVDVLRDLDSIGNAIADYLNGPGIDNKLRQTSGATPLYFIQDHLGTTRALTDSAGAVTSNLIYDSFGNLSTGSPAARYTFTGRESDAETGLINYRARTYDPQQGLFVSEDPIGFEGGDINLYSYVSNNPLNETDPSGLQRRAGATGRGNYKPDFPTRCNRTQDCETLARNMAAIARRIASAQLIDEELGFPRHSPPYSTTIPDSQRSFFNCKRIFDEKCKNCGPPKSPVPALVPNPTADLARRQANERAIQRSIDASYAESARLQRNALGATVIGIVAIAVVVGTGGSAAVLIPVLVP